MEYIVFRDNTEYGPYDREALLEYVRNGIFQLSDYAWRTGLDDWMPLGEVLGIAPPPEVPENAFQVNRPVWPTAIPRQVVAVPAQSQDIPPKWRSNGKILLNLILALIVAGAAYIRFGNGSELIHRYFPSVWGNSPSASDKTASTVVSSTPVPTPARQETPITQPAAMLTPPPEAPIATPPPKHFDIASLAVNRAAWPKTLRLTQTAVFPAIFNGRVAGAVTVQPGTVVQLIDIVGDQLTLAYQGGTQKIPWKMTDIEAEAAAQAIVAIAMPSEAPSVPAKVAPASAPKHPRASIFESVPTDGLQLWLRADIGVTAGDDRGVSAWADQSGNGHDATQAIAENRPNIAPGNLNGLPTVHFDATSRQCLHMPDFLSRWTAGEIVVVLRAAARTRNNGLWTFGTGLGEWYLFGANGRLYGDFGTAKQQCEGPPPSAVNIMQYHVLDEGSKVNSWESWIDGVSFYHSTDNVVGFTQKPAIGTCADGSYFSGEIAEILIYNRPLNVGERDSLVDSLDQKYGLKRR